MSSHEIILYNPVSKSMQNGGLELLDEWAIHPESWIWLNISGIPDADERLLLGDRFGVPQLAIDDVQRERHPPKIEIFDTMIFIMLRDLLTNEDDRGQQVAGLSMFFGANFLISRHYHRVPAIESVFNAVQTQMEQLAAGPAHVAYLVSRRIVDNYTPVVTALEENLAELEDRVFEEPGDDVIEIITKYNRSFRQLRRHLVNQRDVVAWLYHPTVALPVKLSRHEFKDVHEHMERLSSLCQLNQELATDLLNTHLNLVSHRLNHVMRILTIATVIFLPLSLLAGIYGMNFQFMPELSWHYGYFGALGLMSVIVLVLIGIFKHREWL